MSIPKIIFGAWVVLLFAWCAGILQAQDFEKIAPKPVPLPDGGRVAPPPPVEEKFLPDEDAVQVEELKALVFLKPGEAIVKEGLNKMKGVYASGLPLLREPAFQKEMEPFLGQPVSMNSLNELARVVAAHYRKNFRPVVRVSIPEQNITSGVIQLMIEEGKVGEVKVVGNDWFSAENIRQQIRLRPGDLVKEDVLSSDLDWINRNPFRRVNLLYVRGKEPGYTNLELETTDRFPVRCYAGYEDTGNDLTGEERWFAGWNWGNVGGWEHLASYQFTTSSDVSLFLAHSGTYTIPLPWRHQINLFGSYAETDADVQAPLDLEGKSWQVGIRYLAPLEKVRFYEDWTLEQTLQAGFDFKQSDNNLAFGGTPFSNTLTDVTQWVLGWNGAFRDPWGVTSLGGTFYYSPGGWTDNSKDWKYQGARARAEAEYVYGRLECTRTTRLPYDFSVFNSFTWQFADGNLLSSEQFGLGGRSSVRGYDEREANGDEGWLMRHEIRTPPLSIAGLFDPEGEGVTDALVLLGFWDYGVADNNRLLAGEDANVELSSVGAGLQYQLGTYLSATMDYGFQLLDTGNDRYASRLHLAVTLSY